MTGADAALDRVLRVFERGQLSATEMRVLLRLVDHRDAGIGHLAEQLGRRPTEITRAGRRLAMRGLVRTHRTGRSEQTLMEITPSGLATVRTLLTAARASEDSAVHHTAAELIKAAQAFHSAADQTGIRPAVPLSLARTEEALQLLSGAWYQLASGASPRIEGEKLSHEQEVRLIATLHDVAAALARCARSCREGRLAVTPVLTPSGSRSIPVGVVWPQNWCSDP